MGERCGGEVKHEKSVEQCKNKIDNLKKRYKVEVQRIGSGCIDTSQWHWFNKIEAIVDTTAADVNSSFMPRQIKNRFEEVEASLSLFYQHFHLTCSKYPRQPWLNLPKISSQNWQNPHVDGSRRELCNLSSYIPC